MTMKQSTVSLLAQADLLILLADCLTPPAARDDAPLAGVNAKQLKALVAASQLDMVADLNHAISRVWDERLGKAENLTDAIMRLWNTRREITDAQWSDEHHRLFEAAIVCPLHETAYIRRDKGAVLGDLCAFYAAFGWRADPTSGEKSDHLASELAFVGMLLAMRAQAEEAGNLDGAEVTREALTRFADTHLSEWLGAACHRIEACTRTTFHLAAACMLRLTWALLALQHGWRDGLDEPVEPPADEPESPYECDAVGQSNLLDVTINRQTAAVPAGVGHPGI